jgi:hypothetical protein
MQHVKKWMEGIHR